MAKEKKCPECVALPAWLTTFSDLMSLLLTFFVLLLSFSSTAQDDFQKAKGSLQGALGVLKGEPILTSPIKLNVPILRGDITEARPTLHDARAEIEREIQEEAQVENVEVEQSAEGITIRISDRALFSSGNAELTPEFLPLLNKIGAVLARIPNEVEIEGHTDDVPISTQGFRDNYWLSSARALNVLEVFVREVGIAPARLSAIGFGEHRPLVENDSPENRSRNRRVEIKVRGGEGELRQLLEQAELGIE
jgi:chemotaxis protein MotB